MSKKHRGRFKGDPVTYQLPNPAGGVQLETFVCQSASNSFQVSASKFFQLLRLI